MPPTIATPKIMQDPGYLLYAPLGSALPTNTVAGGVFTDEWPVEWLSAGATLEGSTLSYQLNLQAVSVAEFFDPVVWAPTDRTGSLAFAMANWALSNLAFALNTGAPTIVSGTGDTQLNQLDPPEPQDIVRVMLGWESLDNTVRMVAFQAINGGQIQSQFQKAPALAGIAAEFNFEKPSSGPPIRFWSAGTARA